MSEGGQGARALTAEERDRLRQTQERHADFQDRYSPGPDWEPANQTHQDRAWLLALVNARLAGSPAPAAAPPGQHVHHSGCIHTYPDCNDRAEPDRPATTPIAVVTKTPEGLRVELGEVRDAGVSDEALIASIHAERCACSPVTDDARCGALRIRVRAALAGGQG